MPLIYLHLFTRDALPSVTIRRGRMPACQASLPVPRQPSASVERWQCTYVSATWCFRVLPPPRPCDAPAATGCMFVLVCVGSTMATELMAGAPVYLLVMAGVWAHVVGLWRHASDLSWRRPSMAVWATGWGGASCRTRDQLESERVRVARIADRSAVARGRLHRTTVGDLDDSCPFERQLVPRGAWYITGTPSRK